MPRARQRASIGRNQRSFGSAGWPHELLITAGKSAVAGLSSGSASHWAAASTSLPAPWPSPRIAFATSSFAPGATPTGERSGSPPTIRPAVWVPWPLSS